MPPKKKKESGGLADSEEQDQPADGSSAANAAGAASPTSAAATSTSAAGSTATTANPMQTEQKQPVASKDSDIAELKEMMFALTREVAELRKERGPANSGAKDAAGADSEKSGKAPRTRGQDTKDKAATDKKRVKEGKGSEAETHEAEVDETLAVLGGKKAAGKQKPKPKRSSGDIIGATLDKLGAGNVNGSGGDDGKQAAADSDDQDEDFTISEEEDDKQPEPKTDKKKLEWAPTVNLAMADLYAAEEAMLRYGGYEAWLQQDPQARKIFSERSIHEVKYSAQSLDLYRKANIGLEFTGFQHQLARIIALLTAERHRDYSLADVIMSRAAFLVPTATVKRIRQEAAFFRPQRQGKQLWSAIAGGSNRGRGGNSTARGGSSSSRGRGGGGSGKQKLKMNAAWKAFKAQYFGDGRGGHSSAGEGEAGASDE
jgi:hypothetical protein